jgi:hypothetical protein
VHRGFLASFNDVVQPTASGRYDALREARDELMGQGVLPARWVRGSWQVTTFGSCKLYGPLLKLQDGCLA